MYIYNVKNINHNVSISFFYLKYFQNICPLINKIHSQETKIHYFLYDENSFKNTDSVFHNNFFFRKEVREIFDK